jgi:PAS domain S-box-containing protein
VDDTVQEDFVDSLAAQRQRLLHHAGEVLLSGRAEAPDPEALDRLSHAFLASLELLKAAENEMRESRNLIEQARAERSRFRMLFDQAPAALLVTTRVTTIRSANRAAAVLLGREEQQLLGRDLVGMIGRSQQRGFREYVDHVISSGGATAWSFSIQPADRLPIVVKAAVALLDDPMVSSHCLYWSMGAA